MPNELPLPDDLQRLMEKRSGKDRRQKAKRNFEDDDSDSSDRRNAHRRERRGARNYRDLLDSDDDE
jgi:hypothetical protein